MAISVDEIGVWFMCTIIILFIGYEYLRTPFGIIINNEELKIKYPLSSKNIKIGDVSKIELAKSYVKGYEYPKVHIHTKSSLKSIPLKTIGTSSIRLHKILKALTLKRNDLSNPSLHWER